MKTELLIKNLIKQGESNQLEFKQTVHKESVAKTLCSFLNANGGIVLIGLQDDGKLIDLQDIDKHETNLKKYLFNAIIPEAPITISKELINGFNLLLLKVWNGSKPPYIYDNTIYFRRKNQTVKASADNISKMIIERQKSELHWERQINSVAEIDDLDEFEIRKTIREIEQFGRGKVFLETEILDFLNYYGLLINGSLTNSAVTLFAKEPTKFLPQCRVRLTVFNESKISDKYTYDRILEGNLFQNIDEILQFFDVNIASKSNFSDKKWNREDKTFPKSALREGIMNALIHRDYSNISGSVTISFYPNYLEITNYGELPIELKPSDLLKNHLSLPRNPDIAQICFIRQKIEKIGRGTLKIIEDCNNKGFPEPKWQSKSGVTILTFPEVTVISKTDDVVNDIVNDVVIDAVNGAVKNGKIDFMSNNIIIELIEIIKLLANKKEGTSINEIMGINSKSSRTIQRYLQILKKISLIEFKGSAKTGKYYLIKEIKI